MCSFAGENLSIQQNDILKIKFPQINTGRQFSFSLHLMSPAITTIIIMEKIRSKM